MFFLEEPNWEWVLISFQTLKGFDLAGGLLPDGIGDGIELKRKKCQYVRSCQRRLSNVFHLCAVA